VSAAFTPTHIVPASGMRAWETPNGTGPPAATLDPYLEVQVVERRADWARILCSNGWVAWVDGRRLLVADGTPPPPPGEPAPAAALTPSAAAASTGTATAASSAHRGGTIAFRGVGVMTLAGVAAVVIGSFLNWWTITVEVAGGSISTSTSAWDHVPVQYILTGDPGSGSGLDVGLVLLVVLVLLIPLLTEKPFPPWVTALVAVVPIGLALGALVRGMGEEPSLDPAIGMIVVLIGGALIATDAVLMFTAPNRARA
jgi:hypothetical protein